MAQLRAKDRLFQSDPSSTGEWRASSTKKIVQGLQIQFLAEAPNVVIEENIMKSFFADEQRQT